MKRYVVFILRDLDGERIPRWENEPLSAGGVAKLKIAEQSRPGFLEIFKAFELPRLWKRAGPVKVREATYRHDGYCCQRCGTSEDLSIDHKLPLARGGTNDPENLWTLCLPCNMEKRTRTVEEWLG